MEKWIISHPYININNMKSKLKETFKIKHLETKIQKEGNKYTSNILSSFFKVFFSVWEQESMLFIQLITSENLISTRDKAKL